MRFLLLRDLGVKDKVRTVREFASQMSEEDRHEFLALAARNHTEQLKINYPEWIIEKLRNKIWDHLDSMVDGITMAYTIWPRNELERQERRIWQDRTIGFCECLKKDLEAALDVLPVQAEKYLPYVKKINKEISLIKGWRKADNKRFKF